MTLYEIYHSIMLEIRGNDLRNMSLSPYIIGRVYKIMDEMIVDFIDEYKQEKKITKSIPLDDVYRYSMSLVQVKNKFPDFYSWFVQRLNERFLECKEELLKYVKDGKIRIYRRMSVSKYFFKNLTASGKHVGIFWSYTEDGAHVYNPARQDYHNISVLLIAEVDATLIDWEETLSLRMDFRLGDQEQEIRLFKGTPITLVGARIDRTGARKRAHTVDISKLRDRRLVA